MELPGIAGGASWSGAASMQGDQHLLRDIRDATVYGRACAFLGATHGLHRQDDTGENHEWRAALETAVRARYRHRPERRGASMDDAHRRAVAQEVPALKQLGLKNLGGRLADISC